MDFYQFFSYDAPGVKTDPAPEGHKLEHKNKDSKLRNSSLKQEGIELLYLICNISLWTSTKFIYMIAFGSKFAPSQGITIFENRHKE